MGLALHSPMNFKHLWISWIPGPLITQTQRVTSGGSADSALPASSALPYTTACRPSGFVSCSSLPSGALQLYWRDSDTPWYFCGFKMPFTLTQKTLRHSKLNAGQQDMSPLLIPYKMVFGSPCWKWQPQTCVLIFLPNIYNLWISGRYSRLFQSFTIQVPLFFLPFLNKKLNFSEVREILFLSEGVSHHKVQNQMSTDVILCSNLSEYIRLCIHNS